MWCLGCRYAHHKFEILVFLIYMFSRFDLHYAVLELYSTWNFSVISLVLSFSYRISCTWNNLSCPESIIIFKNLDKIFQESLILYQFSKFCYLSIFSCLRTIHFECQEIKTTNFTCNQTSSNHHLGKRTSRTCEQTK